MSGLAAGLVAIRTSARGLGAGGLSKQVTRVDVARACELVNIFGYDKDAAQKKLSTWWNQRDVRPTTRTFPSWTMSFEATDEHWSAQPFENAAALAPTTLTMKSPELAGHSWRTTFDLYGGEVEAFARLAVLVEASTNQIARAAIEHTLRLIEELVERRNVWSFLVEPVTSTREQTETDLTGLDRHRQTFTLRVNVSQAAGSLLDGVRDLLSWRHNTDEPVLSDLLLCVAQAEQHRADLDVLKDFLRSSSLHLSDTGLPGQGREGFEAFRTTYASSVEARDKAQEIAQSLEINLRSAWRLVDDLAASGSAGASSVGGHFRRELQWLGDIADMRLRQMDAIVTRANPLMQQKANELERRFANSQATLTALLASAALLVSLRGSKLATTWQVVLVLAMFSVAVAWIDRDQKYRVWHLVPWLLVSVATAASLFRSLGDWPIWGRVVIAVVLAALVYVVAWRVLKALDEVLLAGRREDLDGRLRVLLWDANRCLSKQLVEPQESQAKRPDD